MSCSFPTELDRAALELLLDEATQKLERVRGFAVTLAESGDAVLSLTALALVNILDREEPVPYELGGMVSECRTPGETIRM
ncbi:Uncharacterised protein [Mycobacteroides abscessus subsp. abscessus]|uniref:hypothetical protein n=1 Tax=Mycobacteroides abscessus TaxID=36809 RepID=UPI0009A6C7DD|nr:hypothetical protein [Mycobacteroides abscessus]SKU46110.1 Uncharacterised protein [Mycobacteroides abscessus subsp. abscessus]